MDIAKGAKFTGTAAGLVWMSDFTRGLWWTIPLGLVSVVVGVYLSFSRWTGRARVVFDGFPPWSLYRMFTGVSWLMSLAALVEAGTPISKAMQSLRSSATPYLDERIDRALSYMKNGDNLGTALKNAKMHFPDDNLIGDLEIYAELDNFEAALNAVADDYLEQSIHNIKAQAGALNSFALLLVSGIIAWVLFGVFDMQNQVQTAM
ncbi:MAG: type II secretion system F family protein, partial [Rickettsiales bacterium]|jgi:type II secretory pathway component PulF|nr:type II secretion system F family protein [Rickettsiales bacterium]